MSTAVSSPQTSGVAAPKDSSTSAETPSQGPSILKQLRDRANR
jgi:hypothetical protein